MLKIRPPKGTEKKKDLNFLPMYLLNEFDFTETMFYPHHFLISTVQIVSFLEPP